MNSSKPVTLIGLIILMIASTSFGQSANDKSPKALLINVKKIDGWGPFQPHEAYQSEHYAGKFSLQGIEYRFYTLNNRELGQKHIIKQQNHEKKTQVEIYSTCETVSFGALSYYIYEQKPGKQFALVNKDKVENLCLGLPIGQKAPNYIGKSLSDNTIKISNFSSKYVLLDFWGTWCGPCVKDTPYLKKVAQKHQDKLQVIGIAVHDFKNKVLEHINDVGVSWPQILVLDRNDHYGDPANVVENYNVKGYPSYYLIDPSGKILLGPHQLGRFHQVELVKVLDKAITQKP